MKPSETSLTQALAEFRYRLRVFLQFSEDAALDAGIQPRQHELLLQVAAAPQAHTATIAWAAERLALRHNSTVELVDRCVREGLLARAADPEDGRRVMLETTLKGDQILKQLSAYHACELYDMAPALLQSVRRIGRHQRVSMPRRRRANA